MENTISSKFKTAKLPPVTKDAVASIIDGIGSLAMKGHVTLSLTDFMELTKGDFIGLRNQSTAHAMTEREVIGHLPDEMLFDAIEEASLWRKKLHKTTNLSKANREELVEIYQKCRNYATESIVKSLYPVNELKTPVRHLYCAKNKFCLLTRVRTNYEAPTLEETAEQRTYLSYSLVNEKNLSHFPGLVWYGFRTGITPAMIGIISPYDADTRSWAENRLELGIEKDYLLDAEDLLSASTDIPTYSQISIKSNSVTYSGPIVTRTPVKPDCVLCVNFIDEVSQRAAHDQKLPILVLHTSPTTICRIHDFFSTKELENPQYI